VSELKKTCLYEDPRGLRLLHWGGVSGASGSWGKDLLAGRYVFCLNFGADLLILQNMNRIHLIGQMIGSFQVTYDLKATTIALGTRAFNFLVVEVSAEWIEERFEGELKGVSVHYVRWWESENSPIPARVMNHWEGRLYAVVQELPEDAVARSVWIFAKVLEFLSLKIFRKDSMLFCKQHMVYVKERVAMTLMRLRDDLEQPLDLESLAKRASLSSTSLSRLVTKETGKSLSKHLRAMRVERALELITQEDCSVTEAAFEVGYNSLSHFTKAVVIETGRRPSDFQ
jgi:AraC-like DNA-binding protein